MHQLLYWQNDNHKAESYQTAKCIPLVALIDKHFIDKKETKILG